MMTKIILLEDFVYNPYSKEKIPSGTKVTLVSDYEGILTIRYKGYTYVTEDKVKYKNYEDNKGKGVQEL
jgi:hypothetical protein